MHSPPILFGLEAPMQTRENPYVKKPRWGRNWNAISKMIKNGVAEGMVTRKLCVEVLDLVLTSFQTSFFSAPTVSKVQITDMLLLSTSFFSYPLPRSHRQGGFEKKNVSIHKLFLSFPNKGGKAVGACATRSPFCFTPTWKQRRRQHSIAQVQNVYT